MYFNKIFNPYYCAYGHLSPVGIKNGSGPNEGILYYYILIQTLALNKFLELYFCHCVLISWIQLLTFVLFLSLQINDSFVTFTKTK